MQRQISFFFLFALPTSTRYKHRSNSSGRERSSHKFKRHFVHKGSLPFSKGRNRLFRQTAQNDCSRKPKQCLSTNLVQSSIVRKANRKKSWPPSPVDLINIVHTQLPKKKKFNENSGDVLIIFTYIISRRQLGGLWFHQQVTWIDTVSVIFLRISFYKYPNAIFK